MKMTIIRGISKDGDQEVLYTLIINILFLLLICICSFKMFGNFCVHAQMIELSKGSPHFIVGYPFFFVAFKSTFLQILSSKCLQY